MVNTPLVPMFGSGRPENDYGASNFGGLSSPGLDNASARLGSWQASNGGANGGIVLDDVRKFRRSARVSGSGLPGGVNGGALGGMYDERQQGVDQQRRVSPSQLNSMQQNAINLGLNGLPNPPLSARHNNNNGNGNRDFTNLASQLPPLGVSSPGGLLAQQAAVAAQANWRNGLGSPTTQQQLNHHQSSPHDHDQFGNHHQQQQFGGQTHQSANVQLANLFALQQQMQLQQLNMAAAAGIALTPVQMMGLQQQQQQGLLSPGGRMMGIGGMGGMGGMGMGGMGGMGMGGMGNMNNLNSMMAMGKLSSLPRTLLDELLADQPLQA